MKYRPFGNTGLEISEIGIGAFPLSGRWKTAEGVERTWSGSSDDESIRLIHRAEELGVNLIDSAEGYGGGHSESVVGRALRGRRDRWIVATKVQPNRGIAPESRDEAAVRTRIESACDASLERLETDRIDLYQLHAVPYDWAVPPVMEALRSLREAGKVRYYGISTNNQKAVAAIRAHGPVDVLQIGYNLLEREADSMLHWAREAGIGTLIRVPLAKGMLTGKYYGAHSASLPEDDVRFERFEREITRDGLRRLPQLDFLRKPNRTMVQSALRFVLDHPGVSSVIAGAKSVTQIEENAAASEIPPLGEDETRRALGVAGTIGTPGWC